MKTKEKKDPCLRIVTDRFAGYEVQKKKTFLFWRWWSQCEKCGIINTFASIEKAKEWINNGMIKDEEITVVWVKE
jgi:hypothetical protein